MRMKLQRFPTKSIISATKHAFHSAEPAQNLQVTISFSLSHKWLLPLIVPVEMLNFLLPLMGFHPFMIL